MKKILLALLIFVVLVLTTGPGFSAAAPAADAVVSEPDFSFGAVAEGKKATHTFVIKNRGDAELRITRVQTG